MHFPIFAAQHGRFRRRVQRKKRRSGGDAAAVIDNVARDTPWNRNAGI
jgi:hypothetical protein